MKCRAVLWMLIPVLAGAAAPAAGAPRVDDARVERGIEKARKFLWSIWDEQTGHWPERGREGQADGEGMAVNYGGTTALCAYALLAAGESHQSPRMRRTLAWLRGVEMHGVYAVALRANALALLPRAAGYDADLRRDVKWLIAAALPNGGYGYTANPRPTSGRREARYDNSNSQLAVLGVWSGAMAGVDVPREYWQRVEDHWRREQCHNGGWNYGRRYQGGGGSYGSMAAAGLATMFICFDAIHYEEFADATIDREYPAITKGLEWMGKRFQVGGNPGHERWFFYYLYGVERVGMASGFKYFADKDWYREGVARLLSSQRGDGSWSGYSVLRDGEVGLVPRRPGKPKVGNSDITTCFALLFLARGRHPILFNKLRYDGSWNCRPRDCANLSRWITATFEKHVQWQVIELEAPVIEWHDAPILYISGKSAPNFSEEHLAKLQAFVHQGGVILSEAVLNSKEFTQAMTDCYRKMFPDFELEALPEDHPIYGLHFQLDKHPKLMGVSNGIRLLAVHSPEDLSRAYQLRAHDRRPELFKLAANIYFFVTDRGSLRHRGVSHWPDATDFTPVKTVRLAVLKHSGSWNPEPLVWKRFATLMGNRHRVKIDLTGPTEITKLRYPAAQVAVMSGTSGFRLSNAEKYYLRKFCLEGGTLAADAAGGSAAFRKSFARDILPLLPEGEYARLPLLHEIYTASGPAVQKVQYRRALRTLLHGETSPRLRGVTVGNRVALVFSPVDLTAGLVGYPCWGLRGYEPESAFALMRNVVLYAASQGGSPATQPAP